MYLLKKDFVPEGKGTGTPDEESHSDGGAVYQAYFGGIFKKLKAEKFAHEKN